MEDGVNGVATGLWETRDGDLYPEEGLAVQLRQYGEVPFLLPLSGRNGAQMFSYLSRLYENALGGWAVLVSPSGRSRLLGEAGKSW